MHWYFWNDLWPGTFSLLKLFSQPMPFFLLVLSLFRLVAQLRNGLSNLMNQLMPNTIMKNFNMTRSDNYPCSLPNPHYHSHYNHIFFSFFALGPKLCSYTRICKFLCPYPAVIMFPYCAWLPSPWYTINIYIDTLPVSTQSSCHYTELSACRELTRWEEEIKANNYALCNSQDIYKITHVLAVNGSYVAPVGHILYVLKRILLERSIKAFWSCHFKAFSPFSASSLAAVSSKLVAGV